MISEASRNEIRRLIPEYRAKYDSIYRCIKAARFVSDDLFATVFCMDVVNKIKKRVAGIIKREIPTHKLESPNQLLSSSKDWRCAAFLAE